MRTLDDLDVAGRRVLLRCDLNVPLAAGQITDDTRIREALPTIAELRRRGASLVVVAHLGRPVDRDPSLSLRPVAERLAQLLECEVTLADAVVGDAVGELARRLAPGDVLLLENVRYEPGETTNDPALARALAELADVYVDDAFGVAHRSHASIEGVAHLLPAAAGRLLELEVRTLTGILAAPRRPLVAVVGGAKVSDKIAVIERFLELADTILIGGAMCFPFLAALGHQVGASLCEQGEIGVARHMLEEAEREGRAHTQLPSDLVVGDSFSPEAQTRTLEGVDVPPGWMGLDIGPSTARRYARVIAAAGTVFWNGPMGAFELDPFAAGTRAVAEAVAATEATTVVGGGDSAAALASFGLGDRVDHLSTGGGATLELIEGQELPGLRALEQAQVSSA